MPRADTPLVTADRLTAALSRAHLAWRPQRAGDWRARLQLAVTDGHDRALVIDGAGARLEPRVGLRRTACLRADQDTWIAICEGRLTVDDAFQQGRLACDDLPSLLRFADSFDWAAAAEQAAHTAAAALDRPIPLPPPRRPGADPVGKRYDGGHALIRAADVAAFARVLADPNPQYEGPGATVPPTFHARLCRDLLVAIMDDPDLDPDRARVLHAGHEVRYHRPLRVGDLAHMRGVLERVDRKPGGLLSTTRLFVLVDGEIAVEAATRFFVRATTRPTGRQPPSPSQRDDPPTWVEDITVPPTAAVDYAAVSLDDNPLHLDPGFARRAGLPGTVLHGLATLGLCAGPILARACGGDPTALRRLGVRWTWPVTPGQDLQLRIWLQDKTLHFDLVDVPSSSLLLTGHARVA